MSNNNFYSKYNESLDSPVNGRNTNEGFVIKTRDDLDLMPFKFQGNEFHLIDGCACTWLDGNREIKKDELDTKLRERIEPWLTALFQSEHLSLLCGSGLTNSISHLSGSTGGTTMSPSIAKFTVLPKHIENYAKKSSIKAGRMEANIEDYIRTANELLRGLRILGCKKADDLEQDLNNILSQFALSIIQGENNIATAPEENRNKAFNALINFLLSFCSRTGNRERLHIFTTNYDRLIEAGAEIAGVHLIDRFVGTLMPIFRSSRLNLDIHYNPPGIRNEPRLVEGVAQFTKLHGSVDWVQNDDEIRRIGLPFGAESIKPYLQAPGLKGLDELKLMVYPNSAKDRETAEYPYVELFRDLAASICRPNCTLVTYGYGFGDDHINRVIKDMLTIPSTHLVIISFDDPGNRITKFYTDISRPAQTTVLIGRLFGNLEHLTNTFLPKAAIDKNTIRMAEILQKRFAVTPKDKTDTTKA